MPTAYDLLLSEKKKEDDSAAAASVMGCLGAIVFVPTTLALSSMLNGFAVSRLWGWFIVPTFHITSLTLVQAIGLGLLVSYMTSQRIPEDPDLKSKGFLEKMGTALAYIVFTPLWAVLIGYIVHLFMGVQ